MGRARGLAALMGIGAAVLVALMIPAAASAGTFTWDLNQNFTATAPGANPDHDNYGGTPWTYEDGSGTKLPSFDTGISGGLAGWHGADNPPVNSLPLVAMSPTSSPAPGFPAGEVVLQPSKTSDAVVTWTSPLNGTIVVSGTTEADQAPMLLCPNATWSLLRNGGSTGSSGSAGDPISKTLVVTGGDRISLDVLSPPGLLDSPDCSATSVTFTISATFPAPSVTLAGPANGAIISAGQPTFSGSASARFGDSGTVAVNVYAGDSAAGTPVQTITTKRSGSSYSAGPATLADGAYTAQAEQSDLAGDVGESAATTFRVKVHPPAFTVSTPASGARTSDSKPTFAGTGGAALGDSSRVSVTVFSGASSSGKSLGSAQATVTGRRWTLRWAHALKLGTYSFQASQSDDAGHTTTVKRSFVIGRAPNVIGSSVSVSRRGVASVPISCTAPGGHVCTGHVLVLTVKSYRTVPGGPAGKIRVMFAYVSIPGGTTQVVKRNVQADALRALRHLRGVHAKVITTLQDSGGPAKTVSAQRSIRLASH